MSRDPPWPPQVGQLLPCAAQAFGVHVKLATYALDPTSKVAISKVRGFDQLTRVRHLHRTRHQHIKHPPTTAVAFRLIELRRPFPVDSPETAWATRRRLEMAGPAKRNDVERRVHFYRAECGKDGSGKPVPFKPAAAFNHIKSLAFESFAEKGGCYFEEGENIYCCWPESATRAQFAVIRRDALPTIEEKGIRKALNLSATAGLVEAIHVRLFADNIVGFDFNFYGPRLARFGRYLNTVAEGHGPDVAFGPLLKRDASEDLKDGKELTMFSLRIHRAHADIIEQIDQSLYDTFDAIKKITDADELEVVVKPKPYSRKSVGKPLLKAARRLAKRPDVRQVASSFQVRVAAPGLPTQTIDLLGDHFIADTRILRQTPKGRALDTEDAYTKIEEAFSDRKAELKKAAALL